MRQTEAMAIKGQTTQSGVADYWGVAARWRMITYVAAVSPLLVLLVLARLYPELNEVKATDWRPLISVADDSRTRGDLHNARHLYVQAGQVASWNRDWRGLVATGCRINSVDGVKGRYSKAVSSLIQASIVAELGHSRQGIATVAQSLSLLGLNEVPSAVLARVQPSWPGATTAIDNVYLLAGCSPTLLG